METVTQRHSGIIADSVHIDGKNNACYNNLAGL